MSKKSYYAPQGGLPAQSQILTDRAMFTDSYAVIPKGTFSDIVTSFLPFWEGARFWVLARPLSGFAETFSQYIGEVQPGGGSDRPEADPRAEAVLFVVEGQLTLDLDGSPPSHGGGRVCLSAARRPLEYAQHSKPAGAVSLDSQSLSSGCWSRQPRGFCDQ